MIFTLILILFLHGTWGVIYWRFWLLEIKKINVDFGGLVVGIGLLNFNEIHENSGHIYNVLVVENFIVEVLCTWGFVDSF